MALHKRRVGAAMAWFSSDPGTPGDKAEQAKPRLWAEGRQRPGFDPRAFLRVSLANSRALAAPVLGAMAARLDRFGTRVEEGAVRVPAARLGRTGRFLPSHITTGRRLRDSAAMTRLAAEAAGGEPAAAPMPFRGWADAAPAVPPPEPVTRQRPAATPVAERAPVQRPKRPAPLPAAPANADGDRDTLEAIRNLMHTTIVEPVHPMRGHKAPPAPPLLPTGADALPELAPAEPAPRSALFKLTGQVLGSLSVGLAFPIGMVQAGIAIARGEDLRLLS